ncbi:hypothetical protein YA0089_26665 [Pseudomonas viridiflava]|uniref:hypothetical protein n=1 Tax=Pseudomonas viridiflava TaxID=33069 RepID=UPI0018E658D6|nr:hypothetical protein [Pseudomonas viridiflava]MBI6727201.1 hypothetical protein [Pseudomonas viridiflava]
MIEIQSSTLQKQITKWHLLTKLTGKIHNDKVSKSCVLSHFVYLRIPQRRCFFSHDAMGHKQNGWARIESRLFLIRNDRSTAYGGCVDYILATLALLKQKMIKNSSRYPPK